MSLQARSGVHVEATVSQKQLHYILPNQIQAGEETYISLIQDMLPHHQLSTRGLLRPLPHSPRLSQVKDHPNIVHLLGKCESDMVTEYFPNYLETLLLGVGVSSDSSEDSRESVPLVKISTRRILEMARDAARGLQALHEAEGGPIVHADLQPRQLLLDDQGVVKINDLNRCRFMGTDEDGKPCPFKISKANGVWRSPEEYSDEKGVSVLC